MKSWESERIVQDEHSCTRWKNPARIDAKDKTIQFTHLQCGKPLQVSMYTQYMYGDSEYDYYLHFETKCMHCKGHKRDWGIWRKSYINKGIKMKSTRSTKQIFIDRGGDHVYGVHGIVKGNNCVYLLDKFGGSFGKLMMNAKYSKQALSIIQKCSYWNILKHAFHDKLKEIRTRQIYFYWLEQSQRNKLEDMIKQDYESMQK